MKTFEEEIEEYEKQFEREHPFYSWFDRTWYSKFGKDSHIAGNWAPHQIFENPVGVLKDFKRHVKYFFQRGFKGYDDRATWDVGFFLGKHIPKILNELEGSKKGTPIVFFGESAVSESGDVSEKDELLARENYDNTIALIKWGFEELEVLRNIQVYGKDGIGMKEFERREKDAKEAAKLLIEYYWEIGD